MYEFQSRKCCELDLNGYPEADHDVTVLLLKRCTYASLIFEQSLTNTNLHPRASDPWIN